MCKKCIDPPEGWMTFGPHPESEGKHVEFSTELCDNDLLPCWQRIVEPSDV